MTCRRRTAAARQSRLSDGVQIPRAGDSVGSSVTGTVASPRTSGRRARESARLLIRAIRSSRSTRRVSLASGATTDCCSVSVAIRDSRARASETSLATQGEADDERDHVRRREVPDREPDPVEQMEELIGRQDAREDDSRGRLQGDAAGRDDLASERMAVDPRVHVSADALAALVDAGGDSLVGVLSQRSGESCARLGVES